MSELRAKLEEVEAKYGDMPIRIRLDDMSLHEAMTGIGIQDGQKFFLLTQAPKDAIGY